MYCYECKMTPHAFHTALQSLHKQALLNVKVMVLTYVNVNEKLPTPHVQLTAWEGKAQTCVARV